MRPPLVGGQANRKAFASGSAGFAAEAKPLQFITYSTLAAMAWNRNGTAVMIILSAWGLIPSLFGLVLQSAPADQVVRRVIVHDEVIFRIPIRPRPGPVIEWHEEKGPKCVPAAAIAGALLSGASSIDFVMRDRSRIRAEMDNDCQALDYYGQFYLQPADDMVCAKREEIRSRIGGSCRIERFRRLKPKLRD